MSRKEFMEELQMLLGELPVEEREEAIKYYDSYFDEAGPEQEQTVLEELGSAGKVAVQILRDYRAEKNAGIYTEQGYQEEKSETQPPMKCTGEAKKEEQKTEGVTSGVYVTNKGLSGGALVAVIVLAILTFPIWISLLATAFGLLVGFICASGGIVVGFGVGGIGCLIAGIATFAFGIFKSFTIPVVGAGLLALGLLVFGIGCLMIAATGGIIRLMVWVVNGIIKLLGRLFHGRKAATV